VDGGQGARAGTLLLAVGTRATLGLGEDTALRDKDNKLVRELLFELTGEARGSVRLGAIDDSSCEGDQSPFARAKGGGPEKSLRQPLLR
jgi:hypothetical protein